MAFRFATLGAPCEGRRGVGSRSRPLLHDLQPKPTMSRQGAPRVLHDTRRDRLRPPAGAPDRQRLAVCCETVLLGRAADACWILSYKRFAPGLKDAVTPATW